MRRFWLRRVNYIASWRRGGVVSFRVVSSLLYCRKIWRSVGMYSRRAVRDVFGVF